MIDEKTRHLIEAGYDGELSAADRALLDEILEQNAGARRYGEEMERLGSALREVPEPVPPEDLQARIVSAIPRIPTRRREGAGSWAKPALALAAAVVLALPLVWIMKSDDLGGTSEQGLTGTMVASDAVVPNYHVDEAGLDTSVTLSWRSDELVVKLGVTSDEPIVTTVEYPADRFQLLPSKELRSAVGSFQCATSGQRTVVASLRASGTTAAEKRKIGVVFSRGGKEIDASEVTVPPGG